MRSFAALAESRAWRPTLVYATPDAATPDAFAVYEPRQFPGATLRPLPTVNEALATYYQDAEWRVTVEGAKGELRRLLQTNRDRCQRKAEALQGELGALDEARRLREEADLLLAFQSELPERAASVTLENPFAAEGEAATITLSYGPALRCHRERQPPLRALPQAATRREPDSPADRGERSGTCACRAVAGRPRAGRDAAGDRARA